MNFFKRKPEVENLSTSSKINWKELTDIKSLETAIAASFQQPVAIFKHSTRCAISRFALKQFENEFDSQSGEMDLYFLDLLAHRDISDAIAAKLQVQHQSPQLILVKAGKAVYHVSHSDIDAAKLQASV